METCAQISPLFSASTSHGKRRQSELDYTEECVALRLFCDLSVDVLEANSAKLAKYEIWSFSYSKVTLLKGGLCKVTDDSVTVH